MSVLVDLLESRIWLETEAALPAWLDAAWLSYEDARLICRLNNPDDLTALRSIIADPTRLLAYPEYPALAKHLSDADAHLLHSTFCGLFHADRYIVLTPGQSEQRYSELQEPTPPAPRAERSKPTLALVSPLPPAASGIANYCQEILPSLAQFYDITLVVERPAEMDAELAQEFDTIDHLQMMRIGRQFDRVMYHFGNSPFHYDYFGLLKAHPGVVVLHDIYLGDCLLSNCGKFGSSELLQAVYASHGWSAIVDCNAQVELAIRLYPACAAVFNDSYGVLVHSDHAADILSKYFGKEISYQVIQIPLARRQKVLPDKLAARQALGFTREEIVYSSFGLINPNKCLEEIMDAWVVSGLAEDQSARLCFVGGFVSVDLQDKLQSWSKSLVYPKQVVVAGYVSSEVYDQYLSATDVAVQLRTNSRGESSAAALDCLGAGLTTIINAHGSMAEIPGEFIIKLPDEFSIQALSNALVSACELGETKGQEARRHVQTQHSPEVVARAYSRAIESRYANSQNAFLQRQHDLLIAPQVENCSAPTIWAMCEELNDLMSCAGANLNSTAPSQLLVDVSAVVIHDLGTGIQRVVRNILRELLVSSRLGYRVEAVYYDFESECFRYARSFVNRFMGLPPLYLSDDPVEARPGDIFLGLDLYYAIAEREVSRAWLQAWRGRGVKICYVVYDLLPIALPGCFPEDSVPHYTSWLKAASSVSDAIVCISRAIADEYCAWFDQEAPGNGIRPHIGYFHLGADMESRNENQPLSGPENQLMQKLQSQPYLLMVGTIEPRKGHEQVLNAMELLWLQGHKLSLVVVGSIGWVSDDFAGRLRRTSRETSSFCLLDYVSDTMLQSLYQNAAGTMMASLGEGFGLPLIEAANYGSPLLARDLPVFREVCGDAAWYFHSTDDQGLAEELTQWLERYEAANLPDSSRLHWKSWAQSAEELTGNIIHQRWYLD